MESRPDHALEAATAPSGDFVTRDGEVWYRIAAHHRGAPFLVNLATDTDLWMFVTSGGGLTAGRVDPAGAVFPYRTVDQLHDAHHHTGPITLMRVTGVTDQPICWEPFAAGGDQDPAIERNLAKNVLGNRLVFEEIHHGLGLVFRYRWAGSDAHGWVRTVTLENQGGQPVRISLLDGVRNILPAGAPLGLYQRTPNLVDAYKTSEVDSGACLGLYSLASGITDRAEALESLRANVAWCTGLDSCRVHLDDAAVAAFRHGQEVPAPAVLNGRRGSFLVSSELSLDAGEQARWHVVLDSNRDHVQVADLRRRLREDGDLDREITAALDQASEGLRAIVASADGLQLTGRPEAWSHHLANVLYNNLRGGVFTRNHDVAVADFADFLRVRNRAAADRHAATLADWPDHLTVRELHARTTDDPDLQRLALEYLPLYFGRRHGDPSRPWNQFAIRVRDRNGEPALHYEGNWRDIFQNWEALALSFPDFLPGMVTAFVNASTLDGFNPYRITRDGIDWEVPEPEDPWSNIGYWGDHQIVYLLKLLESLHDHDPAALDGLLSAAVFSYANVPYRLKSYASMVADPADTITFDEELNAAIMARVESGGSDARLVSGPDGGVLHVTLLEKLLVPALSKLSNFIPDAGIWMNTQRPEWNDANNALAGGGVSMVTLCYLRRYLHFLSDRLEPLAGQSVPVSQQVASWLEAVGAILADAPPADAGSPLGPDDRRRMMDALGLAFEHYRETVYATGPGQAAPLALDRVLTLCRDALVLLDASIATNRRDDGLYHTYNLLSFTDDEVSVQRLQLMLEGQVAALSSGALPPAETATVVDRLFASDLYREDQGSFLLYPARRRPGFLARNLAPTDSVAAIPLLTTLLEAGDPTLLARDAEGHHRFHGDLRNAVDVNAALDRLAASRPELADAVARDRQAVLDLFELVFEHRSYTGRSGVMYGYEGLGCIYWHMVAKLLLAVQENVFRAEDPAEREAVTRAYFKVRAGLGYERSVASYGAFPTDPYSHTPGDGVARQPGMTGQVKEEILTRRGELGVQISGGRLRFHPVLLQDCEFLTAPATFDSVDQAGHSHAVSLPAASLAFTVCQVPVVYRRVEGKPWVEVTLVDGSVQRVEGDGLDGELSRRVLGRDGDVVRVEVGVRVG